MSTVSPSRALAQSENTCLPSFGNNVPSYPKKPKEALEIPSDKSEGIWNGIFLFTICDIIRFLEFRKSWIYITTCIYGWIFLPRQPCIAQWTSSVRGVKINPCLIHESYLDVLCLLELYLHLNPLRFGLIIAVVVEEESLVDD